MKRWLTSLSLVAALLWIWHETSRDVPAGMAPPQPPHQQTSAESSYSHELNIQQDGRTGHAGRAAERDIDAPPGREQFTSWPADMEQRLQDLIAGTHDLKFTSIESVNCDPTTCEIVFTGMDANPEFVDEFSTLLDRILDQFPEARQGSLGTREVAPGAGAFVLSISNEEWQGRDDERVPPPPD